MAPLPPSRPFYYPTPARYPHYHRHNRTSHSRYQQQQPESYPSTVGAQHLSPAGATHEHLRLVPSIVPTSPELPEGIPDEIFTMAPAPRPTFITKDHFNYVFSGYKSQNYYDPGAKGPGFHTVRTLAWNPTGQLIASGSSDRTLRIWNPERPAVRNSTELRGHTAAIEKVLFHPVRDAELASCSADGTVRLWDVRSKTCISRLDVGGEAFTLSWSPDGNTLMVGKKDDTLIPVSVESPSTPSILTTGTSDVPTPTQNVYTALAPHPQSVQTNATTFSFNFPDADSPETSYFLATTGEGRVNIIGYPSFKVLYSLNAHTSACMAVELAPSGRYLAVGGSDALISIWDTLDWFCRRTLTSDSGGAVKGVSWSFDSRFICGASDELGCVGHGLDIFHAESGEVVFNIPTNPNSGIPAVAWHPSRYLLAYSTTTDGPGSGAYGGLKIIGPGL